MLIDDVAQHLHNQGIASLGSTLFKGYLPPTPDVCMSVLDTGGMTPSIDIPTKEPTFQVFIRSDNYVNGKTKLDAVREALHQQKSTQLVPDGTYFFFIFAISEGGHLGRNDEGLDEFSINFRCRTR